jgi:hypothetical protein
MIYKICKVCLQELSLDKFEKPKNRPSHKNTCKKCRYTQRDREKEKERHKVYMRERRKNDPDTVRKIWERSVYGVCKEDIGITCCMICSKTQDLCIDHDHKTGEVRGILCGKCNRAIGLFSDESNLLVKAIEYLKDGPHFELSKIKYP